MRRGGRSAVDATCLVLAIALVCAGCASADRLAALRTSGLRAVPGTATWVHVTSDDGYSFELPGLPLAERDEWAFHGQRVVRTFVDLDVEGGLGAYLVFAFVASDLDLPRREQLRVAAETRVTRAGNVVGVPHEVAMQGHRAIEVVLDGVGRWDDFRVVVRSFVAGDLVFVLAAYRPALGTNPSEAERFFESLRIDRPTAVAPVVPEAPRAYPEDHPED